MKNTDNIESLFKEKFNNFEADVNPQVWTNVQSGIGSSAGGAASAAAKFALGKIVAGVAGAAILAGSVWYFASSNNTSSVPAKQEQDQTQTAASPEETPQQNAVSEDQSGNNGQVENKNTDSQPRSVMPPAVRGLNHYGSDYTQQPPTRPVTHADKNETSTDAAASESTGNVSPQPEAHIGKNSDAPTNLIRGSKKQNPRGRSSKKNTSDNNLHETEQAPISNISAIPEPTESLGVTFGIIPNIFTPNEDGINDLFSFETKNAVSIDVSISDLNGRIVAGWNTIDGSWNGKLKNGENAPDGFYLYSIQATGVDGIKHPKNGTVTLSRKR